MNGKKKEEREERNKKKMRCQIHIRVLMMKLSIS
jgi:hypothetical protein